MAEFDGKVVMITGAASGFGALAAAQFAAKGAKLMLSDLNAEGLAMVAAELETEVLATPLSVADDAAVAAHVSEGVARFGRLDIALNNAGIGGTMARLPEIALDEYDLIMDVNAKGVFIGMRHQIPVMLAQGKGAILNTASAAGLVGSGHLSAYAASKHAVIGMTKAAADEVARKGIRINAICPSFAATPMVEELGDAMGARNNESREESFARIASRVPMARVAEPMEVVQAMLWAVSDANSFMTGQAISIDGGLTAI